jgi:hypothetical protein
MLSRLRHRDIWRRRRGKLRPLGQMLAYNELRALPVKKTYRKPINYHGPWPLKGLC